MSKPRVFHSKTRTLTPWGLRYRSSETTDWFPTWGEALERALVWARVSHVAAQSIPKEP